MRSHSSPRIRRGVVPSLLALTLSLLAACAGSTDSESETAAPPRSTTTAKRTSVSLVTRTEAADVAPAGATTLRMAALAFQPSEVTVKAGSVVFFLVNGEQPLPAEVDSKRKFDRTHQFALVGSTGTTIALSGQVEPQRSVAMTIDEIPPGSYQFNCTRHGQLKMRGTLEVTP